MQFCWLVSILISVYCPLLQTTQSHDSMWCTCDSIKRLCHAFYSLQIHALVDLIQGRNQVCSQRWARLENFPFLDQKWKGKKKKKKKGPLLIFIPFPIHFSFPPPLLQFPFFTSPFSISSLPLFSLSSSFSLFLPFFLLFPCLPKFSPKLSKVGVTCPTHPPLVTPLTWYQTCKHLYITSLSGDWTFET